MTNLLQETMEELDHAQKDFYHDVLWIGTRDGKRTISKDSFLIAANFTYDAGYGGQEVLSDLVLVGDDWWLERGEYDGSEWWDFKTLPVLSPEPDKLDNLRED